MGVSYTEFKHLNPYKLSLVEKGYKKRQQLLDEQMWMWFGTYGRDAIALGANKGIWGKGKVEYPDKPILNKIEITEDDSGSNSREEVAVFEMKQRINQLRNQGLPESPD